MSPAANLTGVSAIIEDFEENVEGKSMRDKLQNVVVTSSMCLSSLLLIGHLLQQRAHGRLSPW